jgi:hypothetical protein
MVVNYTRPRFTYHARATTAQGMWVVAITETDHKTDTTTTCAPLVCKAVTCQPTEFLDTCAARGYIPITESLDGYQGPQAWTYLVALGAPIPPMQGDARDFCSRAITRGLTGQQAITAWRSGCRNPDNAIDHHYVA